MPDRRLDAPWLVRALPLFARLALGTAFLSAVADRFGLWGPPGAPHVAWGDFAHFTAYAARITPFFPAVLRPAAAWVATCAEVVLGTLLIAGVWRRPVALASGVLLITFAIGMAAGTGIKSPLDASVFSAAAAALLLAAHASTQRR